MKKSDISKNKSTLREWMVIEEKWKNNREKEKKKISDFIKNKNKKLSNEAFKNGGLD